MCSYFSRCESCEEIAKRACNCSSPPRLFCDNHAFRHMSSEGGVHPFEDAIVSLTEENICSLKQAIQTYQIGSIQQVISARNNALDLLLQQLRKTEQECSSKAKEVLNGEIKNTVEQLCYRKSLPIISPSSLVQSLLSLKKSNNFSFSNIMKEFILFSSSSLSLSDRISSTEASNSQAHSSPDLIPTHIFNSPEHSFQTISTHISERTFVSTHSNLSVKTLLSQDISVEAKTKTDKGVGPTLQWDLSEEFDTNWNFSFWSRSSIEKEITSIAVSDCCRYLASASRGKRIKIWERGSYNLIHILKDHTDIVTSVSFLGDKVVSGSLDRTVKIWEKERCIQSLELHSGHVYTVAVSSSTRLIASGSSDTTIIVYNLENNCSVHTLRSHSNYVTSVVFSRDDREIVSGSRDKSIKIWKTETGELLRTLYGHLGPVYCVRVSGKLVVSSSGDGSIKVWAKEIQGSLISLEGHRGSVREIDVCNNIVVSIGADNSVRVWDIENFKEIQILEDQGNSCNSYKGSWLVNSLKIIEKGACIVAGGESAKIKIWVRIN